MVAYPLLVTGIQSALVSWTYLLLSVLLIAKILDSVGVKIPGLGGGDGGNSAGNNASNGRGREDTGPARRVGHEPNAVVGLQGIHGGDRVRLWWDGRPADEHVSHYQLQRRTLSGRFRRWYNVVYTSTHFQHGDPLIDHSAFRHTAITRDFRRTEIHPAEGYEYRIRAVNAHGKGSWAEYLSLSPFSAPGTVTAIIDTPAMDAPDIGAVRVVGDNTAMAVEGRVNGPAPSYDSLWGLYDNGHNLVVELPCTSSASGVASHHNLDFTHINLRGGAAGVQLPQGDYVLRLFAQVTGTGPVAAPVRDDAVPASIVAQVERRLQVTTRRFRIEPLTHALPHGNPLEPQFGRAIPYVVHFGDRNQTVPFAMREATAPGDRIFHLFFTSPLAPGVLTLNQLNAQLGINHVFVSFQGSGDRNVPYHDNFTEAYPAPHAVVSVQFDCENPPALPRPFVLFVNVVVEEPASVANHAAIQNTIRAYAPVAAPDPAAIASLRGHGVYDFNRSEIFYIN